MDGSSCGWTSFAGPRGALDPQGRTSFLYHLVPDRDRLGLGVVDVSLEHDDRMPVTGQRCPPPPSPKPFLIEGGRHALSLCKVPARQDVRPDVVLHEQRGIAEIGQPDFPQLAFDERQRLARLDQVLAVDLLAPEALQLFGDRMYPRLGEGDDEPDVHIEAGGTLAGLDVAGGELCA